MNTTSPSNRTSRRKLVLLSSVLGFFALAVSMSACSSTTPRRDPTGELFPSVTGESLEGEEVSLPLDQPTILLIGYIQKAQFDADRWLVGLTQVAPPVKILEVPTIKGLFPRALSGMIDSGMRSGIPSEDWQSVVTLYGSRASDVVELTGNETGRNIRVLLLDKDGVVLWFHDRGFSAGKVVELDRLCRELAEQSDS